MVAKPKETIFFINCIS